MSLDFIAPDGGRPFQGHPPVLRSPIEWAHREQGAAFKQRAGWRVVLGYGSRDRELAACQKTVGVADVSHVGKLELQAEPAIVSSIVARLTDGSAIQPGRAMVNDQALWCPITMSRVLVLTAPERTGELRDRLQAAASEVALASITDMTAVYGSNAVVGPLARETFARATALDIRPEHFPERAFAPVSVARTPGMVLRHSGDHFLHLFGAGFAHYIWTVFVDAVEHLGGRAVGSQAIEAFQPKVEVGIRA